MVKLELKTFDHAVAHLRRSKTKHARQIVWDYIKMMPTLYFVQRGCKSSSVPWVTFDGDIPVAMVFTDYDRAANALRSFITEDGEARVVGLPTNAASMYITALSALGVELVCFNHGPQRFDAPINEVLLVTRAMKR